MKKFVCVILIGAAPYLPDSTTTPGAINPDVTQENISQTICVPGWTATIRPPSYMTTHLKLKQLADSDDPGLYEEDHLIPLILGGAPKAKENLWPQPRTGICSAATKDVEERHLGKLVCQGVVSLKDAQEAIALDWVEAYNTYVGPLVCDPTE